MGLPRIEGPVVRILILQIVIVYRGHHCVLKTPNKHSVSSVSMKLGVRIFIMCMVMACRQGGVERTRPTAGIYVPRGVLPG